MRTVVSSTRNAAHKKFALPILMLRTTVRPLHSVFTHFLMEKDQLTAHFARFGAGFILENQIKLAKEHLTTMQDLLKEVEARREERHPPVLISHCPPCYKK